MKIHTIIGALLGLAVLIGVLYPTGGCHISPDNNITRNNIHQILIALEFYKMEYGELKDMRSNSHTIKRLSGDNSRKLKFFIPSPKYMRNGEYLDGWKQPLLIRIIAHSIEIRSAGKDGILFTKDDLIEKTKEPNHSLEPTTMRVTPRAVARVAPAAVMSDLKRSAKI